MEIEEHHSEFMKILEKYELRKEDKAEIIAHLLTNSEKGSVSPKEFSEKIGMSEHEAEVFLKFIERGLKFKEANMDNKQ